MSLLEQIQEASKDLETYKNPNINAVYEILSDLLSEADLGCLAGDKIDCIDVYDDEVVIETSYTVRGCHDRNTYTLPMFIVEAENPKRAAMLYGFDKRIDHAKALRDHSLREAERYSVNYEKLLKEKTEFENKSSPLQEGTL